MQTHLQGPFPFVIYPLPGGHFRQATSPNPANVNKLKKAGLIINPAVVISIECIRLGVHCTANVDGLSADIRRQV